MEEFDISHYPQNLQACSNRANKTWKEFLLNQRPHPESNEQHFLPLDAIESSTLKNMPPNINRYILRSVDIDTVSGGNSAFVFSKLGRFVIVGFIEMPYPSQWVGTKVHVKRGDVEPASYTLPIQFGEYLMDKAKGAADVQGTMSERQNKKIEESYKKDFDRVANSESFRAMSHDARLFGRDAFKKGG